VKYFISYEDLVENNTINKKLDMFSPELFIIRKDKKNNSYKIKPILYFLDIEKDILKYAVTLNYAKKGILMVELTKEETMKLDPIFIKKFVESKKGNYVKVLEDEDKKEFSLIDYNCLIGMTPQEMSLGTIVAVMPCKSDSSKLYISADRSSFVKSIPQNRREELEQKEIGADLYFHTDNDELLEKYKDDITVVKRCMPDKYEIISHKLFIIDSIPRYCTYDFSVATNRCYYELCNYKSTPVNIIEDDGKCSLTIHDVDSREKKGYIINNPNLKNIFCDGAIEPLLNYINVYQLVDGYYKKIPLSDYLNKVNIIKYINKKTSSD